MCSITVTLHSCFVRHPGAYFLVAQLDETEYPDKHRASQKFRTDIVEAQQTLRFNKSMFKFEGLTLGNRLVIKFGCFHVLPGTAFDQNDQHQLLKHSKLYASSSYVMTQNFITQLRKGAEVQREEILVDSVQAGGAGVEDLGRIALDYKLNVESLDQQIFEDNREFEKAYFDPFVKDKSIISEKVKKVQAMIKFKGDELDAKHKQLDERNQALRTLAVDLAMLRRTHQKLVEDNEEMAKKLASLHKVDEIHIEIDMLSQSPQGVQALKERFSKLHMRYQVEQRRGETLEKEFLKIEPQLMAIKQIKTQTEEVKKASQELEFHNERYKSVIERIRGHKETLQNQEEIIHNLAHIIKASTAKNDEGAAGGAKETEILLGELRFKKVQLAEKLKQLELLLKMNNGQLPADYAQLARIEDSVESTQEVAELQRQEEALLTAIQETSKKLEYMGRMQGRDTSISGGRDLPEHSRRLQQEEERFNLGITLRATQKAAANLESDLRTKSVNHAKVISDIKFKIAMADAALREQTSQRR